MAFNEALDRKSTRLNSSHVAISYAVFCLKKKNKYCVLLFVFLLHLLSSHPLLYLHSFPTRRSSDLGLTLHQGKHVRSVQQIQVGDTIEQRLSDGHFTAEVTAIEKKTS